MRGWIVPLLCAVAVSGAGAPAGAQDGDPNTVLALVRVDSLTIAVPGRVTGLAWLGGDTLAVLVVDDEQATAAGRARTRLVLQDRAGVVLRAEDVTGVLDRALAWDGRALWSCGDVDGGGSVLYRLEPALLTVTASYPAAGHRPTGLCFDGRFVWLTDRDSGRLDRFDPEVLEWTRTSATPGFSPCGLAWDGHSLWLTDFGSGRLHRLSGSRRDWSGTVGQASFLFRGRVVQLTHDGADLWFLPEGARRLIKVRIS